jgi:hypothetical protein
MPDRDDVVALTAGRREVFRTEHVVVYERPRTPHAWIVHDVRRVARGEALPLLTGGAVDPYETALVEGTPPMVAQLPGNAAESARVTRYEAEEMTIETETAAPGLLVVSEVYEPGWRAYVDGERVEILPTHHTLRGVPIPEGSHTVVLRYEPPALRLGLAISGVATVAMLAVFGSVGLGGKRRYRRNRRRAVAPAIPTAAKVADIATTDTALMTIPIRSAGGSKRSSTTWAPAGIGIPRRMWSVGRIGVRRPSTVARQPDA